MCLETPTQREQPRQEQSSTFSSNQRFHGKGRGRGRYQPRRPPYHPVNELDSQRIQNEQHVNNHDQHSSEEYYTDNYHILYSLQATEQGINEVNHGKGHKYFAKLQLSTSGNKFQTHKFQIDTAATCNTISEDSIKRYYPEANIQK